MTHFFFTAPPTPDIYTLSLHDALPISASIAVINIANASRPARLIKPAPPNDPTRPIRPPSLKCSARPAKVRPPGLRSEEHTSELQSRFDLVCRLLLEKKK